MRRNKRSTRRDYGRVPGRYLMFPYRMEAYNKLIEGEPLGSSPSAAYILKLAERADKGRARPYDRMTHPYTVSHNPIQLNLESVRRRVVDLLLKADQEGVPQDLEDWTDAWSDYFFAYGVSLSAAQGIANISAPRLRDIFYGAIEQGWEVGPLGRTLEQLERGKTWEKQGRRV